MHLTQDSCQAALYIDIPQGVGCRPALVHKLCDVSVTVSTGMKSKHFEILQQFHTVTLYLLTLILGLAFLIFSTFLIHGDCSFIKILFSSQKIRNFKTSEKTKPQCPASGEQPKVLFLVLHFCTWASPGGL